MPRIGNIINAILGRRERPAQPSVLRLQQQLLRARYDAAAMTAENRRHWANADHLSAAAAHSPEIRRILRSRGRYECGSNSYAKGIVLTQANDTIGTGPRLQMLSDLRDVNTFIERRFAAWCTAVNLAAKLRTMRMARSESGEAFLLLANNPALPTPVKLDVQVTEADQVSDEGVSYPLDSLHDDGITFDEHGNPVAYRILGQHPGSYVTGPRRLSHQIPARYVIHYFRADRPGQIRGIPDITPALPLFAQLRRYTLAVLGAAESAADYAVFFKTTLPENNEADGVEPMAELEIERRMGVFLPSGWEPSQVKAEQPATTYGEFKKELLNEIARCLNMPFNIAAGNSAGYNYSSGRLDHQMYFKSIEVDRREIETGECRHPRHMRMTTGPAIRRRWRPCPWPWRRPPWPRRGRACPGRSGRRPRRRRPSA